ncbi:MAG TPA: ShlB/FhaC/HecB family hemolysin secretion/activation protein [Alphaproteobacteria bacterium]|nr:ShlB/FhaC/HecB family hemolysin secretion/activation protein [Alphaproteobacteria bacterium]
MGLASDGFAQQVPQQLPPAAEPGRPIEPPRLEPVPERYSITVPEAPSVTAPAGSEGYAFRLSGVVVEGATAFTTDELAEAYAPLIGTEVTVARMFQAAAEIERRYREAGYITSRAIVPQQTIEDGTFRIQVVEGSISEVVYANDPGPARPMIEAIVARLQGQVPISLFEIERRLLLADDIPGMEVKGALEASATVRGGSRLVITTNRKAYDATASLDNRGSRYSGAASFTAGGALNAFGPNGDKLYAFAKSAVPISRENALVAGYQANIGGDGATWGLSSTYSTANPGYILEPLDVRSRVLSLSATASYPLIRSRQQNLRLDGQFEYRNVVSDILSQRFNDDRLRVATLAATFDRADSLNGITALRIAYGRGLDVLGASPDDSPLHSRIDARSSFNKLSGQITRIQGLPGDLTLFATAAWQLANRPLLASEEIGIGGTNFGRGYDNSEISGDRGIASSIELRYAPDLGLGETARVQFYGFYDIGKVWNLDPGADPRDSLASAGLGIRAELWDNISLFVEAAKPLTRPVETRKNDEVRAFFGLTAKY